jgi:hypothetical protein
VSREEVKSFVAWIREFIGAVKDSKGNDMTEEFWEQVGNLEYELVKKPEYIEHNLESPCEKQNKRCKYPDTPPDMQMEDRHCVVCGWVE